MFWKTPTGHQESTQSCFGPSISHQESDPPASGHTSIHNHLVASLPLEEELSGASVRQARLVVPHQVSAHKAAMVPRVQRSVEQEGVILWSERHPQQRHKRFSFKNRKSAEKARKCQPGCSHVFSKEAMSLLLYQVHVVSEPGLGGPQHMFPSQHQKGQALMFQLWDHRQQLKQTSTSRWTHECFLVVEPKYILRSTALAMTLTAFYHSYHSCRPQQRSWMWNRNIRIRVWNIPLPEQTPLIIIKWFIAKTGGKKNILCTFSCRQPGETW